MNTPLLLQNAASFVVIYLELGAGGPATGLTFSDVTADIKKSSAGGFTAFTLTSMNFTDLSGGFYEVDLLAADTSDLGTLYLNFVGGTIKTTLLAAFVAAAAAVPPPPTPPFTPLVTTIFGYVYNSTGIPVENVSVVARITQQPTIIPTDGILISSDFLTTITDDAGFFTIDLLTGATVEFIITDANYRRTVVIPGSTVNLFDLP